MVSYIYPNLPRNGMVRLFHPQRRDRKDQETFLKPTADKPTHNFDTEFPNDHLSQSPQGTITETYQDKIVSYNCILRVEIARVRKRSYDGKTRNYDTEGSNHHTSQLS